MAPVSLAARPAPAHELGNPSTYREATVSGPATYSKENEEKGTAKQPPARFPNYLPIWDKNKTLVVFTATSTF